MKTDVETFDHGPGGWWGWSGNDKGLKPLEYEHGIVTSRSPWWIDYNHAPPGAGYLHMVFCLNTKGPFGEHMKEVAGSNGFVNSGCPRDFTNAKMTVRIKGELIENGAKLVLLIQAAGRDIISGWMLTGQPFRVTPDWSEQTITLAPDEQLRLLPAYSGSNEGLSAEPGGLKCRVNWRRPGPSRLAGKTVRLRISLSRGQHPEPRLYALSVGS